jgi:tRNA G10  N-methylase Trm11
VKPVLSLQVEPSRPEFEDEFEDGECYPEALVECFLAEYTRPGDVVFDPFAGSGTTLVVAERMGRRPLGLEIHPERVDLIAARLTDPTAIRLADARKLDEYDLPPIDFAMTSPPYMTRTNHPENPLTGYKTRDGDYRRYLEELTDIFERLGRRMTAGGRIVINVANLTSDDAVTPLAFDVARSLSAVLRFEREIVLDWDRTIDWLTNDYCLVFSADGPTNATN